MTAASTAPASAEVISLAGERALIPSGCCKGAPEKSGKRRSPALALMMRMALIQLWTSLRYTKRASSLPSYPCRVAGLGYRGFVP
jgi:hypothetical protein